MHSQFGLGLRPQHYEYILANKPKVDWFEIISENFIDVGGKPKFNLDKIRELYPIVMHGVSLSIGSVDCVNSDYLKKIKNLIKYLKPLWISDHLCWTGIAHKNTHDLLPLPYTSESLEYIVKKIKEVQDFLEMPIALENPSTYLEFKHSTIAEADFISAMTNEANCNLLLDVNNVYVSCYNHGLDCKKYIDSLPLNRVIQIHLSGHSNKGSHIIDTHDNYVIDEVWNLYKYVVSKMDSIPNTMIEWDDNIPAFPELFNELEKAKNAAKNCHDYIIPKISDKKITQESAKEISLKSAQHLMQKAIMLGERIDSKPQNWIKNKEEFSSQDQLNIYINSYRYRLNDVVLEDYPVLKFYLGDKKFHDLIWQFVNEKQPNHFNIAKYSLGLQKFLQKKYPKDFFAHELCLLETSIAMMHEPMETEALRLEHIKNMTEELLMEEILYPRKALKLFKFKYRVNEYYQSVMDEKNPKNVKKKDSYLCVFRHENSVWRMDLEKEELLLLEKIFNKTKVGKALENVKKSHHKKISKWFARWISNGLLAKKY